MAMKNDFIRLSLTKDPNTIKKSLELKQLWKDTKGDVSTSTKGVRKKQMDKFLKPLAEALGTPEKLNIINIGFNNMCHDNCQDFCTIDKNYEPQLGYNITACDCGNDMTMEIHSVLKSKVDGKLYDITADFNDEKSKWFVPIKHNNTYKQQYQIVGRRLDCYNKRVKRCKCGISWDYNNNPPTFDPEELCNAVKIINKIQYISY